MKCPKCNDDINHKGLIWHLKNIDGLTIDEIVELIFEELETIRKQIKWNFENINTLSSIIEKESKRK